MKADVRFGPAGLPIGYRGESAQVCNYIKEIGLGAYEFQATYGCVFQNNLPLSLKRILIRTTPEFQCTPHITSIYVPTKKM